MDITEIFEGGDCVREHKFRAFIKSTQQLVDVEWIDFKNKRITYNSIDFKEFGLVEEASFDEIELLEFTGLYDKHQKPIYEGDIVKWGHVERYEETPNRIAVVEFKPDIQYQIVNFKGHRGEDVIFRHGCFLYSEQTDKALEVIGNIYEHKNLLEGAEG